MKSFLALFLFVILFSSCAPVQDPQFRRVEKFGLRGMSLSQATIGFSVTYFNPNNFGVNVKEAVADVYLDTTYLGKFVQDGTVDVKKNSEFSIPFTGAISLATALHLKVDDLANKPVLLKANGNVKVGKAGVYVSKDIKYEGRHQLSLKF